MFESAKREKKVANNTIQKYKLEQISYSDDRAKVSKDRRRAAINKGWTWGSNLGNFIGASWSYPGNASNGHSEEQMLNIKGCGIPIGGTFSEKAVKAQDKQKSISTNMYTELEPCKGEYGTDFNCNTLLDLALNEDSRVYYSFSASSGGVTKINDEVRKEMGL